MVPTGLVAILAGPAYAQEAPADELPPLVKDPEVVEFAEATWPPDAAGLEATVELLVTIDETGAVTDVEVITPAGHGFDEAAMEAARRLRFSPAEDATGPVPVAIEFDYHFELAPEPPPVAVAPVNVDGLVREMGTRTPIAGVLVQARVGDVVVEATTGEDGRFELRGVPAGDVAIVAKRPNYVNADATVALADGEAASVSLWLRATSYRENEAVGVYEPGREPQVTRRTLSIDEVRRVPGTFGDPVRVIQSLPGAARAPFATGLLVLRGANPEDSNVYVDGVEVPLVYHLGGFRSIVNPDLIRAVDYLPGTYGVRYGRSIGGVVDVRTQTEFPEQGVLTWRTDFLDTGAYVTGRAKNVGFAVGARRSYLDAILSAALKNQEFYAAPRWGDYQLKLQSLGGRDELSAFVFGFQDNLVVRQRANEDDEIGLGYSTHRIVLGWRRELSERVALEVRPAFGIDGIQLGFGSEIGLDLDSALVDLRGAVTWTPSERVAVAVGLDSEASRQRFELFVQGVPVDADDPLSEEEPIDAELGLWTFMPDPYVETTWRPDDRLTLVGGARLDVLLRTEEAPAAAVEPRAGFRWEVVDGGTLKGGSGLYHQPLQGVDLGTGVAIDFERAIGSELGWEQDIGPAVQADVTGFWRPMDRLAPEDFDAEGTGIGRAYGAEVMVRHAPIDRFFGWVSYTLSRSERNDHPGNPRRWHAFDFDQTHILTTVGGYRLPYDFELSGRFQYVTGNPYTPYDGGLYQMDQGTYVGFQSAKVNGLRMPPFLALDVRVDKLFTFRRWQLEVFADFLNVARGENPEFVLYSYDYTEHEFIRGLPLIPSLGFQAKVWL